MELEAQFHQEMLKIYVEASKLGYYPTRFRQMVEEYGGLAAAQRLLSGETPSDGFARLWELGRLDLTVECLALGEPWRRLFTDAELREAERRLM